MRRRNFRKKGGTVGAAEEGAGTAKAHNFGEAGSKPKAKKNLLSFDDEEEPLVTLVRKPQDVRYSKKKDRAALQAAPSTQLPSAGEYSKEHLSELQNATPRMPQSKKDGGLVDGQEKDSVQSIIKLSGSFKPRKTAKDDRFETGVSVLLHESTRKSRKNEEGMMLPPPPRPPQAATRLEKSPTNAATRDTTSHIASDPSVPPQGDESLDDHFIPPDTKTIRMAKAKRERLRQAHLAPDYLPLGGASSLLSQDFKHKDMAKNSDSEEEVEEGMRMKFIGGSTKSKSSRPLSIDMDGHCEEADDDKEADDEFVKAQIRKGIGQGNTLDDRPAKEQSVQDQNVVDQDQLRVHHLSIPPLQSLLNNASEIKSIVNRDLERLAMSKKQSEQNLNRTRNFLRDALEDVGNLKSSLELAGKKYVEVQEMKEYIADVTDCLQSKAVLIEELEHHMSKLMQDRADEKMKAQLVRDTEDMKIAEASVLAALEALSNGSSPASAVIAADAAAETAEASLLGGDKDEGVDEFGRSLKLMRQSEVAARSTRRKIRWTRSRQDSRNSTFDLEASSDDSDGERERFLNRCNEVVHTASSAFADADTAFGSLNGVQTRLGKWKASNPSGYQASYMAASVPALVAPFVRLEMLSWYPLVGGEVALDKQEWYGELEDYGLVGDGAPTPQDEDHDLIPVLVSKIVLPLAVQLIDRCWSPFSLPQTRAVAEILREFLVYVPADNPKLHMLLTTLTDMLTSTVGSLQLPPWPQAAVNVSAAAEATINIRFRRVLRLMKGICCFDDILSQPLLRKLTLEVLVGKVLLGFLHSGVGDAATSVERLSAIFKVLPRAWFSGGPLGEASHFMELVSATAKSMESQRVEAMAEGNLGIMKSAKRLVELQTVLGDLQGATRIRKTFELFDS